MRTIFLKEINNFLNSLIAYIVIGVFLTSIGLLMWVFPESSILEYGYSDMGTLFTMGPYVFMFLVPAITMRMFAEEKRSGTAELLFTRPLTSFDIIGGKYLAGFFLVVFSLLPTLLYYFSVYSLGNPVGNLDTPGIIGSYIGLTLLGGVFVSIGIFASSVTENQVVSFILAVFLSFIMYSGLSSIASINVWGNFSYIIEQFSVLYHYGSLSKGLIDLRDIVYFLSVIAVMLLVTNLIVNSRKW
jgi:ABC-2 type transport system permease protein